MKPKRVKRAHAYAQRGKEMAALRRLWLRVFDSEKELPLYLQTVNPSHLLLENCTLEVLASMSAGKSGPNWDMFSHIQHVEAYADDGDIQKKWRLIYTREPYNMETNIEPSGGGEGEENVDNNQDENEEERMCHDLQDRPVETPPSGLAGLLRSGDEDEEAVVSNQTSYAEEGLAN